MPKLTYTQTARMIRALGFKVSRDAHGTITATRHGQSFTAHEPADALHTARTMARTDYAADMGDLINARDPAAMMRAARLYALDSYRGRA